MSDSETLEKPGEGETPNPEPKAVAPVVPPEIEELKRQLADEKAAREAEAQARRAAEEQASRHAADLQNARTAQQSAELTSVQRALEGVDAAAANLKIALREASASGDWDKVGDIQVELGRLGAQRLTLERGKAEMEERAKAPPPPVERMPGDAVEAFIQRANLTPRSAAWARSHPEAVRDPSTFQRLQAAAQAAQHLEGLAPDSDGFFGYIEEKLGYRQPIIAQVTEPPKPAQGYQRQRGGALPPGRQSPPGGKRVVSAADIPDSPALVEAASTSGVKIADYKAEYVRLVNEGAMHDWAGVMK